MKRIGNLWRTLTSFGNLYRASRNARRGKRKRRSVERFEFDLETFLITLRESLLDRSYRPGPFVTFTFCRAGGQIVCCGAAPGTTTPGTPAPPIATGTRPTTVTTTSVFAYPAQHVDERVNHGVSRAV
jgi:hypothetical protein